MAKKKIWAKSKKQYGIKYVKPGHKLHGKRPKNPDRLTKWQKETAREYQEQLIENATEAERVLWPLVMTIKGSHFQRVVCVNNKFYFPDFTFRLGKGQYLYVEIDGGYHTTVEQQIKDRYRTEALCRTGNSLMRFTNDEVLSEPHEVAMRIINKIRTPGIS